jgi:hypothetical protein
VSLARAAVAAGSFDGPGPSDKVRTAFKELGLCLSDPQKALVRQAVSALSPPLPQPGPTTSQSTSPPKGCSTMPAIASASIRLVDQLWPEQQQQQQPPRRSSSTQMQPSNPLKVPALLVCYSTLCQSLLTPDDDMALGGRANPSALESAAHQGQAAAGAALAAVAEVNPLLGMEAAEAGKWLAAQLGE